MKAISPALFAHMCQDAYELAVIVKLVRQDGTTLTLTNWTDPIFYDGDMYNPEDGITASAIKSSNDLSVDQTDVTGILSSDQITDVDLAAGLYDEAFILVRTVNPVDLTMGHRVDLQGYWGELTINEGSYKAEFRSKAQPLQQQIGAILCPACRVLQFGDSQCAPGGYFADGSTLAEKQFDSTVTTVTAPDLFTTNDTQTADTYRKGKVTFLTGANTGLTKEIMSHTVVSGEAVIQVFEAFPYTINPGDTVMMEEGCDRLATTCEDKFNNLINNRGYPDVPGNDKYINMGRPPGY